MAETTPRAPFQRLRRALLGALALALAALGGLYWLGRQGAPVPEPVADAPAAGAESVDSAAASEGFEFEQQVDGKPVFRIAGDRFRAGQDGKVNLEGVELDLYREGEPYRVVARGAVYDPETKASHLEGGVEISGGDGFSLRTDAVDLAAGGVELESRGAVTLRQGEALAGEGSGLRLDFRTDRYYLEGPARLRSAAREGQPGIDLTAARVVVERGRHAVRAQGDVVLVRGDERLVAQQLSLYLGADDETPRALEAKWEVEGRLPGVDDAGGPAETTFSAKDVTVDFEGSPARPIRISLEAERGSQVLLSAPGPGSLRREIAARYLVATLSEGRLATAQGFQPVYFSEHPKNAPDRPLRTGQADQVEAEFDGAGRPVKLTFVGRVSFKDASIEGNGERGFIDLERGRAELFGKRVRVASDRGELFGPHLAWDRATGLVTADGGVQSRLDAKSASLLAGAQAGARGPVRIESQEAFFQERPRGFVFRGKVQAWQGESVLFAEQLRGEEAAQRLSAAGGVKTIWREAAGSGSAAPSQTEITAETLSYRRDEGTVTYSGGVRMTQGDRALAAGDLVASLAEDERVRAMVATGAVRLEESGSGRTVTGSRVEYDLVGRTALFEGTPVTLEDRQGTRIEGRKLLYDLATGSARMLAETP